MFTGPICVVGTGTFHQYMDGLVLGGVYRFFDSPEAFLQAVRQGGLKPGKIICSGELPRESLDVVLDPHNHPCGPSWDIGVVVGQDEDFRPHRKGIVAVPLSPKEIARYLEVTYSPEGKSDPSSSNSSSSQ